LARFRTFRTLCGCALTVFALAASAVSVSILRDRANAIEDGVRNAHNIAVVLGGQIARSIQSIDIVLRAVQGQSRDQILGAPPGSAARDLGGWRDMLQLQRMNLPQAFQIAVADTRGQYVVSSAAWPKPNLNVADREYFKEHAANDDDRLSISLPFCNRITGESTIVLARRINGPGGFFLGVVFISVKRSYFEAIYGAINSLPHQSFALLRPDGTVIIRYPGVQDYAGQKIPAKFEFHDLVRNGGGSYRSAGAFDPIARWIAVNPLHEYPLVVNVGTPEEVLLRGWRARASLTVAVTLIFLASAVVLLWIMARQFRNISTSETAVQQEREKLLTQNQRFDAALNNMHHGLVMFDAAARVIVCNNRFLEISGLSPEQVKVGCSLREAMSACQKAVGFPGNLDRYVAECMDSVSRQESSVLDAECADGRIIQITRNPMCNGGWVTTHEDITERRRTESEIRFLAHNDPLTGIANRSRFVEQIGEASERLRNLGEPFCVLMLDLDRLKVVNDSLGHAVGDALLKEAAKRVKSALRATDVLARIGGDEFAIIQMAQRNPEGVVCGEANVQADATALAVRIIDVIGEPYDIDGRKLVVGISVGVAIAPKDAVDPAELLKKADLALYRAKSNGRNGYEFFDADMSVAADERQQLETDLRQALSRNELELYYQPLVNVSTRQPCCMEALVRWRHPQHGLISPDRFIPLAEETHLIIPLGNWILQTACAEAASWPSDIKVAVNVSAVQFRQENLVEVIMCALVESGLPSDRMEIEITERVLLEQEAEHMVTLHRLRHLGISIALDDFGTGYSSLSYLTMFPFDKIKIDKSFIDDLQEKSECAAIVCAVANLARSLDIVTTGEGVETEEQFEALRAAGISQAQGFLFGRPVPAAEIRFDAVEECRAGQAVVGWHARRN
jgi:diguanylate cyclase (GGDEF)-like protein/PAS domain S-box-containing protein